MAALANLHFGGPEVDLGRLQRVIDRTRQLDPDLVVLLGDYGASPLEGEPHRAAMRELADALTQLTPPLGTVAIMGNHDWAEVRQLLAHEPDILPAVPARFALTLSGHTHGGQVKIFGRTPVVPSRFGSRYVHGHVIEGGRHLVASAGLGVSTLPIRIGTRPRSSCSSWVGRSFRQQSNPIGSAFTARTMVVPPTSQRWVGLSCAAR